MTGKAEIFKFTTNVPVNCNIRFVDVRPGKPFNDPQKGPITLPAQVSIKGTFDGVETIAYLKGPVWKNIKALAAGGVIADDWAERTDELEGVTASTSIPVVMGNVKATLAKGPKDKYENMVFGNGAPAAPKRLSYEEAAKPSGPSRGALPFDEESFPSAEYAQSIHGADEDAYSDPRPLPAFHKPPQTKAAETAPLAAKKAALFDEYMSLTALVRKHSGHTTDDAIQATTFSIFKMWKDGGLV